MQDLRTESHDYAWVEATGGEHCQRENEAELQSSRVVPVKEFDFGSWSIRLYGMEDRAEKARVTEK